MTLPKVNLNIVKESLKDIRNLKKLKLFLIEDIKTFEIAIEQKLKPIRILITEELLKKSNAILNLYPVVKDKSFLIKSKDLNRLKQVKTNQGLVAFFRYKGKIKPDKNSLPYYIFLDKVQDPGNMGTIIRTALNFNIRKLYISEGSASIYNPKVVRGSMGAVFSLPIVEKANFKEIFTKMREEKKQIFFTSSNIGKTIDKIGIKPGDAIVFGNESSGISEELEKFATGWLKIAGSGKIESLSVAVATSIIMSDLFKKHMK